MSIESIGADRNLTRVFQDRRIPVIVIFGICLAFVFWFGSRYPQLNEKALMGGAAPVSGLAFDVLIEVLPETGFWWEVAANTVNWIYTNWKGMTFGLLFGACLLTGLSLVQRRSFGQPFADAALGAAIGAPLGVCVNCAAPIAQGLHLAGTRLETTLAALIASPTLNVIVVSMSFALLPGYMAAIKLISMLGFILIVIPLLCRFVFKREVWQLPAQEVLSNEKKGSGVWQRLMTGFNLAPVANNHHTGWFSAASWVLRSYLRNLVFLVVLTVPLMLVAGALGAFLTTVLPFHLIAGVIEPISGTAGTLISMALVAGFAILLPVPIAFDVIVTVILVNSGWPAKYAIPLMLGLGSFSIYSFFIIARAVSWRVAGCVMALLAGLAFFAGVIGYFAEDMVKTRTWNEIDRILANAPDLRRPQTPIPAAKSAVEIEALLEGHRVQRQKQPASIRHDGAGDLSVSIATLAAKTARRHAGAPVFTRLSGSDIGLAHPYHLAGDEIFEPYLEFWTIASGDIHGDGWDDVAIAADPSTGGIALYANVNGTFLRQEIDLGPWNRAFVNAVAFVDLNGDGELDLFFSTFEQGAHVLWNRGGRFDAKDRADLPNGDAIMLAAPAFGDLDGDGDLDIVAGNWSVGATGSEAFAHTKKGTDRIIWNEGREFRATELSGLPGETLTNLISDVNHDGLPDILIGDDIAFSDKVYLNKGARRFELVKKSDGLIPAMTWSSMSFDSGDIDNDLRPDLYLAQIAYPSNNRLTGLKPSTDLCRDLFADESRRRDCFLKQRSRSRAHFLANFKHPACNTITDPLYRATCAAMSISGLASRTNDPQVCARIPSKWDHLQRRCQANAMDRIDDPNGLVKREDYIRGFMLRNVLLNSQPGQGYSEIGNAAGVGFPGWSWNAKFIDLDEDGWQDIFVATGYLGDRQVTENNYYRNLGGNRFANSASSYGLSDAVPTTAYALLDFDRDGDVDIIRPSVFSQPIVHRNDKAEQSSLWVNLMDHIGNSRAIGARIIVHSDSKTAPAQMRHIKQSGGFASFDAPKVHFGLGDANQITRLEIFWPDGAYSDITGNFKPGTEIHIDRSK